MHYQQFLAISSLILTGVFSAPVRELVNKGNGINSAADEAYEFKIAFSDEAKLATNPAWAPILKDPAFKSTILKNNPVLTNPIKELHSNPKRDITSAADEAYEFVIKFSDESKLASNPAWAQILKDPAFKNTILKNNPVLTNTIKGLHSHPKRDVASAADEAYEFVIKFSDESKLASNPAWAQILKDPAFKGSILKNNPVLTNPIKGLHPKRGETDAAEEA